MPSPASSEVRVPHYNNNLESDEQRLLPDTQSSNSPDPVETEISPATANGPSICEGNRAIRNDAQDAVPNAGSKNITISTLSMAYGKPNNSADHTPVPIPMDDTSNIVRLICVPSLEVIEEEQVEVVESPEPYAPLHNPRFDSGNYQLSEMIYKDEPLVAIVYGDALLRTRRCSPASLENGQLTEGYPNDIDELVKNDQQALISTKTQPLNVSKSDSHKLAISTKIREPHGLLQYQHSSRKNKKLRLHKPFRSIYTKKAL
ncbi:hypothetical protein H4R20_006164 [Coemansia guatemalensis]|uniref:Uncharacterized protein n=1 Tax=Coemansia guatemalensis TaxID=2761395 RepID=A0A9W8LNY7_9FUNG|nr:hypothetical protein H4R20_006164 [Coemansia guatemalensis]